MCGISGVFGRDGTRPTTDQVGAMNRALGHRGPDAEGVYVGDTVGLGHRRLSIIDPGSSGDQPLFNEDETVAVVFNGEIYNYQSLRSDLSARHSFGTDTDTEVLVHLYEEHGVELLDRLEGMFAFAIWDETKERLLLARDRMGIKPLAYTRTDGAFAFASEVSGVRASGVPSSIFDETALATYTALGYVPAPRTAYRDVKKLHPGEAMVVTTDDIRRWTYWEPTPRPGGASRSELADRLRSALEAAVEKRTMSDVPLGAFLSGGVDSTIVTALLSAASDDPVPTFTVGYDEPVFDESELARSVAEHFGTDHHEFVVRPDDVLDAVPDIVERLDEPFADPSLLPSHILASRTVDHVTVALGGDGADELFAGYNKYAGERVARYYQTVPRVLRANVVEPLVTSASAHRRTVAGDRVRKAQKFVQGMAETQERRHVNWMALNTADERARLLAAEDADTAKLERDIDEQYRRARATVGNDWVNQMLYVDTTYLLPNQMLTKVDRASMLTGLEVRVPFLDTDVVETALGMPGRYKLGRTGRKQVLKRAFDDLIPEQVLRRDKHGFDVPVGEWFKTSLRDSFWEVVRPDTVESHGVYDYSAIESIFEEHVEEEDDHSRTLWACYVFERWARNQRGGS